MVETIGLIAIGLFLLYCTFVLVVSLGAAIYFTAGWHPALTALVFIAAFALVGYGWYSYFGMFEVSVKVTP